MAERWLDCLGVSTAPSKDEQLAKPKHHQVTNILVWIQCFVFLCHCVDSETPWQHSRSPMLPSLDYQSVHGIQLWGMAWLWPPLPAECSSITGDSLDKNRPHLVEQGLQYCSAWLINLRIVTGRRVPHPPRHLSQWPLPHPQTQHYHHVTPESATHGIIPLMRCVHYRIVHISLYCAKDNQVSTRTTRQSLQGSVQQQSRWALAIPKHSWIPEPSRGPPTVTNPTGIIKHTNIATLLLILTFTLFTLLLHVHCCQLPCCSNINGGPKEKIIIPSTVISKCF